MSRARVLGGNEESGRVQGTSVSVTVNSDGNTGAIHIQ